jgi:hypothetical protein
LPYWKTREIHHGDTTITEGGGRVGRQRKVRGGGVRNLEGKRKKGERWDERRSPWIWRDAMSLTRSRGDAEVRRRRGKKKRRGIQGKYRLESDRRPPFSTTSLGPRLPGQALPHC